jgi:MFS family permease
MRTATGRRTPLIGFLVADAVSLAGTRISMIAIPWLVLTTTGSAAQTGLVAFAELLPLVVVQALAGPVIDRLGARRVAITGDLLSMAVVGLIPLLHLAGALSFPALLALVAVAGGLRGAGDGAKHAFVPAPSAPPASAVRPWPGSWSRSSVPSTPWSSTRSRSGCARRSSRGPPRTSPPRPSTSGHPARRTSRSSRRAGTSCAATPCCWR